MNKLSAKNTEDILENFGERVVRLSKINLATLKKNNSGSLQKSIGFEMDVFRLLF